MRLGEPLASHCENRLKILLNKDSADRVQRITRLFSKALVYAPTLVSVRTQLTSAALAR